MHYDSQWHLASLQLINMKAKIITQTCPHRTRMSVYNGSVQPTNPTLTYEQLCFVLLLRNQTCEHMPVSADSWSSGNLWRWLLSLVVEPLIKESSVWFNVFEGSLLKAAMLSMFCHHSVKPQQLGSQRFEEFIPFILSFQTPMSTRFSFGQPHPVSGMYLYLHSERASPLGS